MNGCGARGNRSRRRRHRRVGRGGGGGGRICGDPIDIGRGVAFKESLIEQLEFLLTRRN